MAHAYAEYLGDRDPIAVLHATPRQLRRLAAAYPNLSESSPAPGKWSFRQVVCHLSDCELFHGLRLRQALAEDNPTTAAWDPDRYARSYTLEPAYGLQNALDAFMAFRRWNLDLVQSWSPATGERLLTHPERGTMNVATYLRLMAGHDRNHLTRLAPLFPAEAQAEEATST